MTEMIGNERTMDAGHAQAAPHATLHEHQPLAPGHLQVASRGTNMPALLNRERLTIESMGEVPITLTFEVGRTVITIKQLMELCKGSFIPLRHVTVDSIDVRVSGRVIAVAEAIGLQQWYGIRMGEVEIPPGMDLEQL